MEKKFGNQGGKNVETMEEIIPSEQKASEPEFLIEEIPSELNEEIQKISKRAKEEKKIKNAAGKTTGGIKAEKPNFEAVANKNIGKLNKEAAGTAGKNFEVQEKPKTEVEKIDEKTAEYEQRLDETNRQLNHLKKILEKTPSGNDRMSLEGEIRNLENKKKSLEGQLRIVSGILGPEKERITAEQMKKKEIESVYAGVEKRSGKYESKIAEIDKELKKLNDEVFVLGSEKHRNISNQIKSLKAKKQRLLSEMEIVHGKSSEIIGEIEKQPAAIKYMPVERIKAKPETYITPKKGIFGRIKSFFGF